MTAPKAEAAQTPQDKKEVTFYLRDYVGVDCRFTVPSIFLTYEEADCTECEVREFKGKVNSGWEVCAATSGGNLLFDEAGRHIDLFCNIDSDFRVTSLTALTGDDMILIPAVHA